MNIRRLKADEIECRVAQVTANGCSLLLYKTARVDRAILDEHFGCMNWQNDFKVIDGKMYGGIGICYDNNGQREWVWKWDCGTESNTEAEKGQASDCFKRAGFKWGIGVELYTAPFIWVNCKTEKNEKNKYIVSDKKTFTVKNIEYSEKGEIAQLEIIDDKGTLMYKKGTVIKKEPTIDNDLDIYEGLKTMADTKRAFAYFQEQLPNVNDKTKFRKEYQQIYNKLKAKENK